MTRLRLANVFLIGSLLTVLATNAVFAQDAAPEPETPAPAAAPAVAAPPAEAKPGDSLPSKLTQSGIALEELEFRVVPLTKDELKALAEKSACEIVKGKTEEVMDGPRFAVSKSDGVVEDSQRERLTELHA